MLFSTINQINVRYRKGKKMNSKRFAIGLGVVILAGLFLFFGIHSISEAKSVSASVSSSSNDVGAGAPWIGSMPAAGLSSSSNDVGAGAPRVIPLPVTGNSSAANDVGAGAPWIDPLPATGNSSTANDVGTYRILQDYQGHGWRDAGAGSREQ